MFGLFSVTSLSFGSLAFSSLVLCLSYSVRKPFEHIFFFHLICSLALPRYLQLVLIEIQYFLHRYLFQMIFIVRILIPYHFILLYLIPVKYYPLLGILSPIWYLIFSIGVLSLMCCLIWFLLISHFMCWCVLESITCWFDSFLNHVLIRILI